MLETVREYGRELLDAAGETPVTALAHAEWWIAMAEVAEPGLVGPDRDRWILELQRSHDNIRGALRWALDTGHPGPGLRLSGRLWRYWDAAGHWSEGRMWLDRLLTLTADESLAEDESFAQDEPDAIRARAYNGAGNLAWRQTDLASAIDYYHSSLALSRAVGDDQAIARALGNLASVTALAGRIVAAIPLHEESLAVRRRIGDLNGVATTLNNLAVALVHIGELDQARGRLEEAVAIKTTLGDRAGRATFLANLADLDRRAGDHPRALALLSGCVAELREVRHDAGLANALQTLGDATRDAGLPDADVHYRESLAIRFRLGDPAGVAIGLEGIAAVGAGTVGRKTGADREDFARAARFLGAAAAIREAVKAPIRSADRPEYDRLLAAVRGGLTPDRFDESWQAGAALTVAEAAEEAATDLANPGGRQEVR
jgi:tetratricopeptide (TPR) repeat protein